MLTTERNAQSREIVPINNCCLRNLRIYIRRIEFSDIYTWKCYYIGFNKSTRKKPCYVLLT